MAEERCWHANRGEQWRIRGSGLQIEVNEGGGGVLACVGKE